MKRDKLFEECLANVPEETKQEVSDRIDDMIEKKKDFYLGKHWSFHITWRGKDCFEFNLFPFISIDHWRILMGWLFITIQYTYDVDL